ncbi:MAG TPA: hypothetical protein VGM06_05995, partial [Polyangiaceae bacterium]
MRLLSEREDLHPLDGDLHPLDSDLHPLDGDLLPPDSDLHPLDSDLLLLRDRPHALYPCTPEQDGESLRARPAPSAKAGHVCFPIAP